MLSQPGISLPIMFAFLFGFAAIRAEEIPNGIMPQKRQVVGTGVTSSTTPTTSTPPTTQSTSTSTPDASTSTQIPVTSTTPSGTTTDIVSSTSLTRTSTPTSTTNTKAVQTVKASSGSATVVKVGSTTINPKTLSTKTTVRVPLVTKATSHKTLTSTYTSNGQVYSSTYITDAVFRSTTGFATATITPGLADAGGSGANLDTNTKKVIGGVVGGIGGAILIGGLAFVAWRLWGKKRDAQELPQEETYSNDASSMSQTKRLSRNTLDTYSEPYSNPNGAVNTASNF